MTSPNGAMFEEPADDPAPRRLKWNAAPIGRVAAPLRDQAVDVVRQGILNFELEPGQRLVERELIEQLGVSRATVREVVARLASEGLVTIIPQRGAIVTVLSAKDAADIYDMRVSLEALAVERFVDRASDEQVRRLRAVYDELAAVPDDSDDNGLRLRLKDSFYQVLLAGAASPPLTEILTMLQDRVRLLRRTSLSAPGRPRRTVREIKAIVDAIQRRDSAAAQKASATHVRNAAKTALARMTD